MSQNSWRPYVCAFVPPFRTRQICFSPYHMGLLTNPSPNKWRGSKGAAAVASLEGRRCADTYNWTDRVGASTVPKVYELIPNLKEPHTCAQCNTRMLDEKPALDLECAHAKKVLQGGTPYHLEIGGTLKKYY